MEVAATFQRIPSAGRIYLLLLALQFGLLPHLTRYIHSNTKSRYNAVTFILCTEFMRVVISAVSLGFQGRLSGALRVWSWKRSVRETLLVAVIYAGQDWLVDLAQRPHARCPPVLFLVLNQTKTLWGSFFLWYFVGMQRSGLQWFALTMLFSSAVLLLLDANKGVAPGSEAPFVWGDVFTTGVVAALFAALLSGLSQMLTFKLLRVDLKDTLVFSLELSCFKIALIFAPAIFFTDAGLADTLQGFSPLLLLSCTIQAAGGLLVGLVVRHAGGDWKGYALILGLVISAGVGRLLDGVAISPTKAIGMLTCLGSLFIYNAFPPNSKIKSQ